MTPAPLARIVASWRHGSRGGELQEFLTVQDIVVSTMSRAGFKENIDTIVSGLGLGCRVRRGSPGLSCVPPPRRGGGRLSLGLFGPFCLGGPVPFGWFST